MNFTSKPFTDLQKIQLLQRSILVTSYVYYELNDNIQSDRTYEMNTQQLLALKRSNPEAWKKSRYYKYFDNFESGTGYDLIYRIMDNKKLFQKGTRDATVALRLKNERERML